jgi:hypothetical protein
MGRLHDPSTEQIKRKLKTPQSRNPVTSHAGVASVGASGVPPRQHDCADDCGSNGNAATNAALLRAAGSTPREQPTPGQLVGAGIITEQ